MLSKPEERGKAEGRWQLHGWEVRKVLPGCYSPALPSSSPQVMGFGCPCHSGGNMAESGKSITQERP